MTITLHRFATRLVHYTIIRYLQRPIVTMTLPCMEWMCWVVGNCIANPSGGKPVEDYGHHNPQTNSSFHACQGHSEDRPLYSKNQSSPRIKKEHCHTQVKPLLQTIPNTWSSSSHSTDYTMKGGAIASWLQQTYGSSPYNTVQKVYRALNDTMYSLVAMCILEALFLGQSSCSQLLEAGGHHALVKNFFLQCFW